MRPEDEPIANRSSNPEPGEILDRSRRQMLQGALGATAVAFLGGPRELLAQSASRLGFAAVAASQEDGVLLPRGYTHQVVHAWGDPISNGPRWDHSAANTAEEQEQQVGMHHDGLHFFPLPLGSPTAHAAVLSRGPPVVRPGLVVASDGKETRNG